MLDRVTATVADWARRIGGCVDTVAGGISVTTPQRIVTVSCLMADLREGLAPLPLDSTHGVAGAALLDFVSADWLDAAIGVLTVARLPALFTLSVDGLLQWRPAANDDPIVAAAFARDLARDKNFGPALGIRAAAAAAAGFAMSGYAVETARSDWKIGKNDAAMHRAVLSFVVPAAHRQSADDHTDTWAHRVEAWAAAKMALADAGALDLTVGHVDVLALL